MEISDFEEIDKGALMASFTVTTPKGLVYRNMKLFIKGDNKWVNFPSVKINEEWKPLIEWPKELFKPFSDAILASLKEYAKKREQPKKEASVQEFQYDPSEEVPF